MLEPFIKFASNLLNYRTLNGFFFNRLCVTTLYVFFWQILSKFGIPNSFFTFIDRGLPSQPFRTKPLGVSFAGSRVLLQLRYSAPILSYQSFSLLSSFSLQGHPARLFRITPLEDSPAEPGDPLFFLLTPTDRVQQIFPSNRNPSTPSQSDRV